MKIDLENVQAIFLAHDQHEVNRFSKASDLLSALYKFEGELRSMWKYSDPEEKFTTKSEVVDWCRSKFYECLNEYGIVLDDL